MNLFNQLFLIRQHRLVMLFWISYKEYPAIVWKLIYCHADACRIDKLNPMLNIVSVSVFPLGKTMGKVVSWTEQVLKAQCDAIIRVWGMTPGII